MSHKKYGLFLGDLHCGHLVGLTPPSYQHKYEQNSATKRNKWYKIAKSLWDNFEAILKTLPELDFLVINGDLIEGKGKKSGGTELITADMHEQCNMATKVINFIRKYGKKDMKVIATFGCLTAGHRVLTADLKWRNVEHLKKGDRLLSFTEKLDTVSNNRYFCESTVVENKPIIKNTYRIYLSDGTIIDASEEHPFLINYGHDKYKWVQTQELFKRKIWCENHSRKWRIEFTRIITPWEKNTSYEAGYLSGFFDGEGSLCMSLKTKRGAYNEHTFRVDACQNNNEMFKTVKKFCKDLGIHIGISKKQRDKKILQISIRGGYCRILEFLGRIRPPRLMAKFNVNKMGRIRNTNKNKTYIENIEFIGEKTVWGLGTTSKTYIAEGFMCHNTPYHTSTDGDDWENIIKDSAQIDKIGAHEWINVNGLIFDIKHHIGSSSVPYGRHTAISKEALWNELWALTNMQPRADVIIRSHVHYFTHCGTSGKLCMTLPALQGLGSKFGAKLCSGLVDWGVVLFEITSKTDYNWYPIIRRIKAQKAGTMKL